MPITVVSPWSRGGFINSEVFDHTSVLQFLELWTGVREPNISPWRRHTCGDLTSCFNFTSPDTTMVQLQVHDRGTGMHAKRIDVRSGGTARARIADGGQYDVASMGRTDSCARFAAIAGPTTLTSPSRSSARIATHGCASACPPDEPCRADRRERPRPEPGAPVDRAGDEDDQVGPDGDGPGWYNIRVHLAKHATYLRRFAGHLENGKNSVTG